MLRAICRSTIEPGEWQEDPARWAKELIAKLPDLGSTQPRGVELARLGEKTTEEDEVE